MGTFIHDGGNDMYDNGNYLSLRVQGQWTRALEYNNLCHGETGAPAGRGDAVYATCKLSTTAPLFMAAFHSDEGVIDGLRISGNLGADGNGIQTSSARPLVGANGTFGYWKGVSYALQGSSTTRADPSVNHLIVARSNGQSKTLSDTDSDLHEIYFDGGVNHVVYLLWAGSNGYQYSEAQFEAVLSGVADSCFQEGNIPAVTASPPPPPISRPDCKIACGQTTCAAFLQTSCDLVGSLDGGACSECVNRQCCLRSAQPPPPKASPSPPAPKPPTPVACAVECQGSTCGAFAPYSCDAFAAIGCDCSGCCETVMDLQCVNRVWPPAGLEHVYAFTEGETGRSIRDGGSDMFDGGNYLSVRVGGQWHEALAYTQDCDGLFPTALGEPDVTGATDAHYSTCKLKGSTGGRDGVGDVSAGTLFSAVFHSASAAIDGFLVSGNLGADGGGSFTAYNLTGPRGVHAYYKEVYGAGSDPSISHLVLTRAPPSQLTASVLSYNTDQDFHETLWKRGETLVFYLLWAGKYPALVPGLDNGGSYKFGKSQSELGCDCSGCCLSPLDARCMDRVWPANLPALYSFSSGTQGYYISDGGRDAFDHGNEIMVKIDGVWSSPLYYVCDPDVHSRLLPWRRLAPSPPLPALCSVPHWEVHVRISPWQNQVCDGSNPHPVGNSLAQLGDAAYITCKLPLSNLEYYLPGFGAAFVFVVVSKAAKIDGFMTVGNLGADEHGQQRANGKGDALRGPSGVVGYFKQTFAANAPGVSLSDPSVNHLIFGKGLDGADVQIGATTDSDLHKLTFAHGVSQLYYVMWTGKEGYEYPRTAFQQVLDAAVRSCVLGDTSPIDFSSSAISVSGGSEGLNGGVIFLIVMLILCVLGGVGVYEYGRRSGMTCGEVLGKLGKLLSLRARTSPGGGGGTMPSSAPISISSTPRAMLASNDSASDNFSTAYTPPPSS